MNKKASIILLMLLIATCSESANILFVMPFTSKSHYIMLKPIGLELARRGHNVTVITGFRSEENLTNYHQVVVDDKEIWDVAGIERPNVFTMVDISTEEFYDKILWRGGLGFTKMALTSKEIVEFLAKDNKFDLVIVEQFYEEAFYILAHKYNAPLVLVTTFGNSMRHNVITRNPLQLSTVLSECLDLKYPTSFWGRLRNIYFTVYEFVWWKYWYIGQQEALARQYVPNLPEPVPSLYELQRNTSLMLVNGHFSFDNAIAYLPNIVEIGGVHLTRSTAKLPQDLQKILDESKDGVVYVSFGSNVRSSELPLEKKNAFLKVFSGLKQTVLWKWEDDNFGHNLKNVVVRKWFPQKEILCHPNIKVFISHGGLIGTQEAVFNGVPIIGIPIYNDQYNNLLQAEERGFGRILLYHDINEESLKKNLHEVLKDDSYKKKAQEISARFRDRPLNALDTAMFWIEYVIRNKGADFMKNPALQLGWIEYNMLDVYTFLLGVVSVILFATIYAYKIIKYVLKVKIYPKSQKVKNN